MIKYWNYIVEGFNLMLPIIFLTLGSIAALCCVVFVIALIFALFSAFFCDDGMGD